MNDVRISALEDRIRRLELALSSARRDIGWLSALVFAVPIGIMTAIRLAG